MREQILSEIKRLASANKGQAPGSRSFENATGIRINDWRGIYWAKWSDALQEAGFAPNQFTEKLDTDTVLHKVARACQHYQRMPSMAELKMLRRQDSNLPEYSTLISHFGSKSEMERRVREWAGDKPEFSDVVEMIPEVQTRVPERNSPSKEGFVYLIKWGANYKIGRGEELEKRVKQVRTALPDAAELVHSIRTDDPPGIELYWHRRFADKRVNGEWFKLSTADVAAFRRRKYQ